MRLTEKNSIRQTFRGQKARHQELEERLCDYMDNERQYGYAVTSEMYQLKALAVNKELGITGLKSYTACLSSSSRLEGVDRSSRCRLG